MKTIDNRGLPCPEPLARTRTALQDERKARTVLALEKIEGVQFA